MLRSRSFATLLAGYAVSALGDGMAAVAISWLAIELAPGRNTSLLGGPLVAAIGAAPTLLASGLATIALAVVAAALLLRRRVGTIADG